MVINTGGLNNKTLQSDKGHPPGLLVCFFTEMWERFSFYGLKALLIFYLTQHFLFSDGDAAEIYGNYFALVYALPILGGILADHYLGYRRAVIWGGILLCLGHLGMAFEGEQAIVNGRGEVEVDQVALTVFYLSLSLIVVGVGFLKPSISSIVGRLYSENDPRRDSGFTFFYMGINIGSATSALACGYLGQTYGWHYGFGLAGIGMLLGLVVFIRGQPLLNGKAEPLEPERLKKKLWGNLTKEYFIYLCSLIGVGAIAFIIRYHDLVGGLLGLSAVLAAGWIIWYCIGEASTSVRERLYSAVIMVLLSVIFFLCFQQAGSSMNLLADRVIDRNVGGWEIPASMFQSVNAFFIILLSPFFIKMWRWLSNKNIEPSTPMKFSLGLLQVGLGFAFLAFALMQAEAGDKISVVWLILAYLLHTTGELCLSPIGLSMITKLSAPRIAGIMMGVWFLGNAAAEFIAALLAATASADASVSELESFMTLYINVTIIALAGGLIAFVLTPTLRRWMNGVH